jgi:hypothetical protein
MEDVNEQAQLWYACRAIVDNAKSDKGSELLSIWKGAKQSIFSPIFP